MAKKYGFISQPMNGLTVEEIERDREEAIEVLEGLGCDVLETYFGDEFEKSKIKNKSLLYLAKSLAYLAKAEVAYFCKGWEYSRGCKIEHQSAVEYGIEIVYA